MGVWPKQKRVSRSFELDDIIWAEMKMMTKDKI